MTTTGLLAEWAFRSSILILAGAFLLWVLRVKDSSIRLAVWTALLCGSLAIPALTTVMPPISVARVLPRPAKEPVLFSRALLMEDGLVAGAGASTAADTEATIWPRAAVAVYLLIASVLLLRVFVGLALSLRSLRSSIATGKDTEGIEIRESDQVVSPVALGVIRPVIVLPMDWREWQGSTLEAVLAHERSHILRYDPAVQLLSLIHRALLWHSPLSWFLDRWIVRSAEQASDDAAVAATVDRTSYAEVLLDFVQRGTGVARWQGGVSMARYGRPDERIRRILDGTALSRGITRWTMAAILTLTAPFACVVAAGRPQRAPGPASQAQTDIPRINYGTGSDGYLLHRGGRDDDSTSLMDVGGIDFQPKSYELNRRFRDFVLAHRQGKSYLIVDREMVRNIWKAADGQSACMQVVEAATPLPDELRKALTECSISEAEIAAARRLRETRAADVRLQRLIEIVTRGHIWNAIDAGISSGAARTIEP